MGVLLDPVDPKVLAQVAAGLMRLTPAEYVVLKELLNGGSQRDVGEAVGIAFRTVEQHAQHIYDKCGCDRMVLLRLAPQLEAMPDVAAYLGGLPGTYKRTRRRKRLTP